MCQKCYRSTMCYVIQAKEEMQRGFLTDAETPRAVRKKPFLGLCYYLSLNERKALLIITTKFTFAL